MLTVDTLAQEIRRVDGNHSLGAGALAEALMPFLAALAEQPQQGVEVKKLEWRDGFAHTAFGLYYYIDPTEDGFVLEKHEGASTVKGLYPYGNEAIAAAQADYETRIRSALVDVPAVESEPVGYLKPDFEQATTPRYIPAEDRTDDWAKAVFTIPVYAHPPRFLSNEGWMPIDTAPKDGTLVLIWTSTRNQDDEEYVNEVLGGEHLEIAQIGYFEEGEWFSDKIGAPTHWQPLPAAPLSTRKGSAGDGSATGTSGGGGHA